MVMLVFQEKFPVLSPTMALLTRSESGSSLEHPSIHERCKVVIVKPVSGSI